MPPWEFRERERLLRTLNGAENLHRPTPVSFLSIWWRSTSEAMDALLLCPTGGGLRFWLDGEGWRWRGASRAQSRPLNPAASIAHLPGLPAKWGLPSGFGALVEAPSLPMRTILIVDDEPRNYSFSARHSAVPATQI